MIKRASKNLISKNYKNILNVGYANLANLLKYDDAKYCNHGIYGWNWSVYELNENTCIITGYRNTLGEKVNREFSLKIDDKAREIIKNNYDYEKSKKLLDELKDEFLNNYKKNI